jgi:DNA gyrase subunit B
LKKSNKLNKTDNTPITEIETQEMDLAHDELKANDEYGADQISALEGLDAIRARPAMYVSSTSQKGVNQLCWEIIDNSVDEYVAGHGKEINFHIFKDCSVEISDSGRGIPVGVSDKFKDEHGKSMNVLTVVLTKIHAGGKFATGNYKASAGSYGVGQKAVVALSDDFVVKVKRDGHIYQQTFSKGKATSEVEIIGKTKETGTTIKYHPDATIFKSTIQPNSYDVKRRIAELASLNAGLQVNYKNDIDNEEITFLYEDGIIGYTKRLAENKNLLFDNPFYVRGEYTETDGNVIIVETSFIYDDESESNQVIKTFANNINTYEGGTHLAGFRNALKKGLNEFAIEKKLIKSPIELKYLLDGIYATISIKIMTPELDGQTKTKLGNTSAQDAVETVMNDFFNKITKGKNQFTAIFETIIDRATKVKEAEEAARRARAMRRTATKTSKLALPGQLADCANSTTGEYSEICLVEGQSASGCFPSVTRIRTADGRMVTIGELVKEHEAGKKNYVFSSTPEGEVVIEPIANAFKTKHVSQLAKVILDNGEEIKCTPDHRFMLRDGSYKQAKDLTIDDSLMPLYMENKHKKKHGVETDYITPYVKNNHTEKYEQVHRMVAKQYYGELPKGYNTHHIDRNPQNNNPENLVYLTLAEHRYAHKDMWTDEMKHKISSIINEMYKDEKFVEKHKNSFTPEVRKKISLQQHKHMQDENVIENLHNKAKEQWSNEALRKQQSDRQIEKMKNKEYYNATQKYNIKRHQEAIDNLKLYLKYMIDNGYDINCKNYESCRENYNGNAPTFKVIYKYIGGMKGLREFANKYNHRIKSVEIIKEEEDVYDLTVPPYNNFALAAGVFVHNSAKAGRHPAFQAILPLKGKVLNVEKASLDKMLNSPVIKTIIAAFGAGVGKTFNIDKLRYDKILIMSDADSDGLHIRSLLLTLFYNYMPGLIQGGYVYATVPPLYKVTYNGKQKYLKDDHELKEFRNRHKGQAFQLDRFKGLGEMNPDQLRDTTLSPEFRVLRKITMEDAEAAAKSMNVCMGPDAAIRREFIEANADKVNNPFE